MSIDDKLLSELSHNPFVQAIVYIFGAAVASLLLVLATAALQALFVGLLRRNCRRGDPSPKSLARGLPAISWARERLARVAAARAAGAELDLAELSSDTGSRAHIWLSFARHASSVLVLLGLCGAVFGLFRVISQLGDPLQDIQNAMTVATADKKYEPSNDPALKAFKELAGTLQKSLEDTRGAFGASISGILATVVLIFAGWAVSFALDSVLLWLDRVTQRDLLPLFPPQSATAGLTAAVGKFEQGTQFLSTLGNSLTDQSARLTDYMSGMYSLVERFGESASGISSGNERLQASQDKMQGLVERFVDGSERMRDAQSQSNASLDALGARLDETLRRLEGQSSTQAELRVQMEEGLQKNINLVRDLFETKLTGVATASAATVQEKLDEHGKRLAEMSDKHAEFLTNLTESVSRAKGHKYLVDGLRTIVEEERAAVRQLAADLPKALERALAVDLPKVLERALAADRRQIAEDMSKGLRELASEVRALRSVPPESPSPGGGTGTGTGTGTGQPLPARDPALARLVGVGALAVPTLTAACLVYLGQTVAPQSWTLLGSGLAAATCGLAAVTLRWLR